MALSNAQRNRILAEFDQRVATAIAPEKSDREVLTALESFGRQSMLAGFFWRWGPAVYARNPAMFRPFILANSAEWYVIDTPTRTFAQVEWKGDIGAALERWLATVDQADDVLVFKLLYRMKLGAVPWKQQTAFHATEIERRWKVANTPAGRAVVLRKLDIGTSIDEELALRLYADEPALARDFILRRLPGRWMAEGKGMWSRLLAASTHDAELHWPLYRRQVAIKDWAREAIALASATRDPAALDTELEKRHPAQRWEKGIAAGFSELLSLRGEAVIPYIRRHLRELPMGFDAGTIKQLVALAAGRGWWELWAGLLLICGGEALHSRAVLDLIGDRVLPEQDCRRRLALLSGVSREWNFAGFGLARIQHLTPAAAVALYTRFPDLARGPFRAQLAPGYQDGGDALLALAIERGDGDFVDFLASRLCTREWLSGSLQKAVERAADHYQGLRASDADFARRAALVLTQIPAYAISGYKRLLRVNRLARLLFERSIAHFLGCPTAVADLIEGSEIHVQQLAYRTLGLADPRARTLALKHLSLLSATLLRPLQRRTRMLAFAAIDNAGHDPAAAAWLVQRARDALALPDRKYPKDELIGLIGRLLYRHPALRTPAEAPVVYRRAALPA